MSRGRPRKRDEGPEQLSFPPPQKPTAQRATKARVMTAPEQAARVYIARRAKPSVVPGHVKLTFTFDLRRELAEALSERAIREGLNMEAVILDIISKGVRK